MESAAIALFLWLKVQGMCQSGPYNQARGRRDNDSSLKYCEAANVFR